MPSVIDLVAPEKLQELAAPADYKVGQEIVANKAVEIEEFTPDRVTAHATAGQRRLVELTAHHDGLHYSCTCNQNPGPCGHVVAVAMVAWAKSPSRRLKLESVVFYTADLTRAVEFYTGTLGLELEFFEGDRFASLLFFGGGRLGIKKAVEDREVPGAQTVFLATTDIHALFDHMKSIGANILKELTNQEGIGLNFSILDPDKNKVQFFERK